MWVWIFGNLENLHIIIYLLFLNYIMIIIYYFIYKVFFFFFIGKEKIYWKEKPKEQLKVYSAYTPTVKTVKRNKKNKCPVESKNNLN